jgi:membrane dipeptidase
MVALAWAEGSRWAGGDQSGGDITPVGKQLITRLDALGIIHDVSHLSEKAFWTLLEIARGPIVASHSNCRALLLDAKHPERHLSDAQIRAIAARNGKIGINCFARFLTPAAELTTRRPTIADIICHMTHIETIAGTRRLLALGSDMDSGFGTDLLPADLQGPADLPRLAEAISRAGWNDDEIRRFAWGWS